MFGAPAYVPPKSEEERRIIGLVQNAKTEAAKIGKLDGREVITVEACPWGCVVTGKLFGHIRRMETTWEHYARSGGSPTQTVRNIADILGLRKAS